MNITDVGHLTGDNLGDADTGEDRLEKASKKEGRTAWDIAQFYADDFRMGYKKLNLTWPKKTIKGTDFTKATDYIAEQIALVTRIEQAGFTYRIDDGIYFDTREYEAKGNIYGELSNLDEIKAGARVEPVPGKKDPRDFALWKFSPNDIRRQMEWNSPWGIGFPGWHIECSAMIMSELGEQIDLHVGGEDLRSTHHPNEIVQSESATGKKQFVKYWVHGAFLQVNGGRMGKSLGNAYTITDIEKKGFTSLDLRYFYLTGHYRKPLNFTWEALTAAANSLRELRSAVVKFRNEEARTTLSGEKLEKANSLRSSFEESISDDLNMPKVLSVVWEVIKSNIPSPDKYDLLIEFDQILGFDLRSMSVEVNEEVPATIVALSERREMFRKDKKFADADRVRKEIEDAGYSIEDTSEGAKIQKK